MIQIEYWDIVDIVHV